MSPQTEYKGLIAADPRGHEHGQEKLEQVLAMAVDPEFIHKPLEDVCRFPLIMLHVTN